MVRVLRTTPFVPARTAPRRGSRISTGIGTKLTALFGVTSA